MRIRAIATVASGAALGICATLYFNAVQMNSQVTGLANWWPYAWLWAVVISAGVVALIWVWMMLELPGASRSDSVAPSVRRLDGPSATSSKLATELGVQSLPGRELEYLETRVRASDQRHVVTYRDGPQLGVITPTRGGFMALHVRNGEVGPFDTFQDAMKALWEID